MDIGLIRAKAAGFIKKYKYIAIIILVGIVLMLLPNSTKSSALTNTASPQSTCTETEEEALANILCRIDGAGDVKVYLSVAEGAETVYQTDIDISASESSNSTKNDTITVTDSDRNQTGLIKQINPPRYQGAIILCKGAESAAVRLAIMDAVSKATGLSYDHISVLKMK